jgi:hypothetical protein
MVLHDSNDLSKLASNLRGAADEDGWLPMMICAVNPRH